MVWNTFPKRLAVGVDIGTSSIKVVALSRNHRRSGLRGTVRYIGWCNIESNDGAEHVHPTHPQRNQAIRDALRQVIAPIHRRLGRVIACIPGEKTISRQLTLGPDDLRSDEELGALAFGAVRELVTDPDDGLSVDYVLDESTTPSRANGKLHVFACRKRLIDDLSAQFESAGIVLNAVEIDALSLARFYSHEHRDESSPEQSSLSSKCLGMLSFDWGKGRLMVVEGARILLCRVLTTALPLGVLTASPESMGKIDALVLEIERLLEQVCEASGIEAPDSLMICGEAGEDERFCREFEIALKRRLWVAKIDTPGQFAERFPAPDCIPGMNDDCPPGMGARYALAMGLAMAGLERR